MSQRRAFRFERVIYELNAFDVRQALTTYLQDTINASFNASTSITLIEDGTAVVVTDFDDQPAPKATP